MNTNAALTAQTLGALALLTTACAAPLAGADMTAFDPRPQLQSPQTRAGQSLNGTWQVVIDPYDTGSIDYLSNPRTNGFWSAPGPQTPTDPHEWSFTDADTLQVPADWNSQRPTLFFYEGTVWYRQTFTIPGGALAATQPPDQRSFLCFEGANKRASVWLNGHHLGDHAVGFTPFHFEVTDYLRAGENAVTVRVNNTRRLDGVPAMNTDWWNYGGLTRDVRLVHTPATFIRHLHADFDGRTITVSATLDGPTAANTPITFTVEALQLSGIAITNAQGHASLSWPAPASLQRWSPAAPTLYDLTATATPTPGLSTKLTDRVGFRTITTRGADILLNDRPVFLRGISIHEEALSHEGRATSEADARDLLTLAKELGCNYVRLAHYPHNPHMLRVADELGLLVWAEIPVYWTLDYDNPATLAEAKLHLTEMIERDRGRAAIIFWSIGNETGDDPTRTAFRLALGRHVKALDPTRLLSAAMFAAAEVVDGHPTSMRVEDPFGELADVLAINSYIGWYWGDATDLRTCPVTRAWDKPLLISEFGAGMKHGLRGAQTDRWTEDFGLHIYRETLAWADQIEGLAGLSPWVLKDFRSPRRQLTGVQDWYNLKGLVDHKGQRKAAFKLLQQYYANKRAAPSTNAL